MQPPLLLHITDAHLTGGAGVELARDDHKALVSGILHGTREEALGLLLSRLAERLTGEGRSLDCVIFTGDAAERGKLAGHGVLRDIILDKLAPVGINPAKIVATPGNHDVPRASKPGSAPRYMAFVSAWRDAGCITPWLDGVDSTDTLASEKHRLVGPNNAWAVFPINSANWSQSTLALDNPLRDVWGEIPELLGRGDAGRKIALAEQLESLIRVDMARVSEAQLEALRKVVAGTPEPASGDQLRIAAIHHHLRTPSMREEVKAFADFTNLELLRATLRSQRIDVVLHGHKHQHAAQRELIYGTDGRDPRRVLVISGATFDERNEADAVRMLRIDGLPWAPAIRLTRFALLRPGAELQLAEDPPLALWRPVDPGDGSFVVQGENLDTVYHRACEAAQGEAKDGTLVVDLDLDPEARAGVPSGYPAPPSLDADAQARWFDELAGWWQARHSRLERRVPYHHGSRLYRYAGVFDQIARVTKLLDRKAGRRALAVLVDPMRDFTPEADDREDFPSFCLVQFRKREVAGRTLVDVVGYYRAQEFRRWWPINVAELRALQLAVCGGKRISPGRITTVTPQARVIARSPTEVSVPVIDRWLDQHPGRLFLLATYLAGGGGGTSSSRDEVIRGWFQSLDEFQQATEEYNADGVPLAMEGLEALASYVDALEPDGDLKAFSASLTGLARANRAYAATKQERDDFGSWGARNHLGSLLGLSAKLLGVTGRMAH